VVSQRSRSFQKVTRARDSLGPDALGLDNAQYWAEGSYETNTYDEGLHKKAMKRNTLDRQEARVVLRYICYKGVMKARRA
jgi:hypothetical protein